MRIYTEDLTRISESTHRRPTHTLALLPMAMVLTVLLGTEGFSQHLADADRDGVINTQDLCPTTPPGAAVIAKGCAALDVVQSPEVFTNPVRNQVQATSARMKQRSDLSSALRESDTFLTRIEAAADKMRSGAICDASGMFLDAQRYFGTARQGVTDARTALLLSVRGRTRTTQDADVDATDLALVDFDILDRAIEDTRQEASAAVQGFQQACASVIGRSVARGQLQQTDDGKRRILVDGVTIGLAENYRLTDSLGKGYLVDVSGYKFKDGTGIAESITVLDTGPILKLPRPEKCLFLRFVPNESPSAILTFHDSDGYKSSSGVYGLEQGMKVAVKTLGCPLQLPVGYHTEQSVEVRLQYYDTKLQFHADYVMAADINSTDDPVSFPKNYAVNSTATMIVRWFWRDCSGEVCGPKMQMDKQTNTFVSYLRNYYCSANYNTTVLTLDDQDQVTFQPVYVKSLTGPTSVGLSFAEGNQVKFRAEAYKVLGNNSSTYPNAATIETACSTSDGKCSPSQFAVFNADFYEPTDPFAPEVTGVNTRAGLMWPRIEGYRNGKPFLYSCSVPNVIRDAINENTFYRYPFYPGYPVWYMGQGNNGSLTHKGDQQYAFDFRASAGTPIRAARGGTVTAVVEDQINNSFGLYAVMTEDQVEAVCKEWKCFANYLVIRHQDGSEAKYIHMPEGGVVPEKGQKVFRGDVVGYVGNTGYSTNPHLHFHEQLPNGPTTPICFDTLGNPCFIPNKGDFLFSNNQ
jgi:murein DD-endopeptidase MepM/ murein hydrolase activator NlpD